MSQPGGADDRTGGADDQGARADENEGVETEGGAGDVERAGETTAAVAINDGAADAAGRVGDGTLAKVSTTDPAWGGEDGGERRE